MDILSSIYQRFVFSENTQSKVFLDLSQYAKCMYKAIDTLNEWIAKRGDKITSPEEAKNIVDELVADSQTNLQKIVELITNALNGIGYNGTPIKLAYYPSKDSILKTYDLAPATGNSIYANVGNKSNGFLVLVHDDGKVEVDDIIEAGDSDWKEFFNNEQEQNDYFTAIQALQNLGKKNRILTLYTARPQSDREFYQTTDTLPANIFLTNSWRHAEGLAHDLSVNDTPRDVYRVRISTADLLETLPGSIQYFQLVRPTKVQSIERVS